MDTNSYFLNWSEARGLGLVALDRVPEERSGVFVGDQNHTVEETIKEYSLK